MKLFAGAFILGLAAYVVYYAAASPPTVEAATTTIAHTEASLKEATVDTRAQAAQLAISFSSELSQAIKKGNGGVAENKSTIPTT